MAEVWKGGPVAAALSEKMAAKVAALKEWGITPTLAILRVGERDSDLSYERGAMKRCAAVGIEGKTVALPADVDSDTFFETLQQLNEDDAVNGILMLRPLPEHLEDEKARKALLPEKDVDGCTDGSLSGVFTNTDLGFPPCTAQAAMEILDHYGVNCRAKRAVVIGRSLVVGRPAAMMLLHKNATVTICHTKTENLPAVAKEADILVVCAGQIEAIGKEYLREGQIVIDVGIHFNAEKRKLCGDVKFDEAEDIVAAITPVPGGVGSVTTAVLAKHVVEAAARQTHEKM